MVWEPLSEKRPFDGLSESEVIKNITKGSTPLKIDEKWDNKVKHLLSWTWKKDPSDHIRKRRNVLMNLIVLDRQECVPVIVKSNT
eukprot:UN20721